MKKWLIALCCILAAVTIAFVTILNSKNGKLDALNKDLGEIQATVNSLTEKNEESEKAIKGLNQQVEDLTAERDQLALENGQLNESLDGLNRNLSSSQQKLQSVMYILTDGAQGSIESVLAPYVRIYEDVKPGNVYFEAVGYVSEHKLMVPIGEEVFGLGDKATLGELAEGLWRLEGKSGTQAEAVEALLAEEKALAVEAPVSGETANDANTSTPVADAEETPADAAAETAEENPVKETAEADEETTAEEAAGPAEETLAEEVAEPAEETESGEAEPAEEAMAEAEADESLTVPETAEENAAETEAEVPEASEDENTVLTRERLLSLCGVYCQARGKALPVISLPASEAAEALRGDLAIALCALAQSE